MWSDATAEATASCVAVGTKAPLDAAALGEAAAPEPAGGADAAAERGASADVCAQPPEELAAGVLESSGRSARAGCCCGAAAVGPTVRAIVFCSAVCELDAVALDASTA